MASSSVTSSGSHRLQNSGSEEDLQQLMDQRKRKRMISNRDSARRSRMRKQKQLDDLAAQVAQLRKENSQFIAGISFASQHYLSVEAENRILRAQISELTSRLQSLEFLSFLNGNGGGGGGGCIASCEPYDSVDYADGFMNNPWNYLNVNQPIMAAADMWQI